MQKQYIKFNEILGNIKIKACKSTKVAAREQ